MRNDKTRRGIGIVIAVILGIAAVLYLGGVYRTRQYNREKTITEVVPLETHNNPSGFALCLNDANRQIGRLRTALGDAEIHLRRRNTDCAHTAAFEAAAHTEKLTLLCREPPAGA